MDSRKEKKRFSVVARIKSITHAWRGLVIFLKTTHNAWVQIFLCLLAVFLGFCFRISNIEWMLLILSFGLLLVVEALNTAMEIDIDLTSPAYHPYARDTKDVAAGAVLIMALIVCIISLIIFLPKFLALF
jgi:diacylglycerol kinase (ATP)